MERLTYDFCVGDKHCWQVKGADNLECREVCRNQGENGCTDCPIAKAFDRLAAYEETGLEPEEIRDSIGGISPICVQCDGKTSDGVVTEKCGYPDDITKCLEQSKHLCELAQAEKEGRLVVLPCSVGDPVFMGTGRYKITGYEEDVCDGFYIGRDGVLQVKVQNYNGNHGTYGVIGQTAELTREAAEAALEEMEAEYDTGRTTIGNSRLLG